MSSMSIVIAKIGNGFTVSVNKNDGRSNDEVFYKTPAKVAKAVKQALTEPELPKEVTLL